MEPKPRIDKLKERREQIEEQIKALEMRQQAKEKKQDTRRKILIGAMFLERTARDEDARRRLFASMDSFLTRSIDRELFGLPEKKTPDDRPTPKPARDKPEDPPPRNLASEKVDPAPKPPPIRKTA